MFVVLVLAFLFSSSLQAQIIEELKEKGWQQVHAVKPNLFVIKNPNKIDFLAIQKYDFKNYPEQFDLFTSLEKGIKKAIKNQNILKFKCFHILNDQEVFKVKQIWCKKDSEIYVLVLQGSEPKERQSISVLQLALKGELK